ncbi:MAG: hypothetical protein A2Z11_02875 [Candidatus Woykebacteria bacterium RBG_16_43_9]|uniref:PsbP C-terminal domain-containing protein n=1 Tax=Candidatus Woykebacteria bacterium RBG_16_43_9 TaxID=1802596 RepID=A0A1G1WC73_9BACT|nr:MAG: hypothetical protein A2Z11_02875 [Candidatus Woykebacteria bacterium RBG_16_43_9]
MTEEKLSSQASSTKTWPKVLIGLLVGVVIGIILLWFSVLFNYSYLGLNIFDEVNIFKLNEDIKAQLLRGANISQTTANPTKKAETADWKNYEDSQQKYSLKYDPSFRVETLDETTVNFLSSDYKLSDSNKLWPSSGFRIQVTVVSKGPYKNLDVYESTLIEEENKINKSVIMIDGSYWRSFDFEAGDLSKSSMTFTMRGNLLYVISVDAELTEQTSSQNIYKLMLATFKFLD